MATELEKVDDALLAALIVTGRRTHFLLSLQIASSYNKIVSLLLRFPCLVDRKQRW
jgi:hypothetical protein